jgi:hypothetical protein
MRLNILNYNLSLTNIATLSPIVTPPDRWHPAGLHSQTLIRVPFHS